MNFNEWLSTLPGSPTHTTAATRSKLTASTLIRHSEKGASTADNVIAIARAFGVSAVDALVDNGFLREDEIDTAKVSARQALADLGIDDALRIVVDRVNASGLFETPFTVDEVLEDSNDELAPRRSPSEYEIAAALDEANQLRGAAHPRTPRLDEPDEP